MATFRKISFRDDEIYHVFNRGMDHRNIFTNKREFYRAQNLIKFYRHKEIPARFSHVVKHSKDIKEKILEKLFTSERIIDILSYCLMPNHFHFLLKQTSDKGIATFISNFSNAYTKYFNTKAERTGPLLEGVFKAVHIESEEQLIHVSRYIHLNPVASSIIPKEQLNDYLWSSYPEYIGMSGTVICEKESVLGYFKSITEYQKFVEDQIDYAKQLDAIKHLVLEV